MARLNLTINGKSRSVDVDPKTPLIYVLRNDLGLKGAKFGCGLEQCGACRVLVDGKLEYSCSDPVDTYVGREIMTIEGIGTLSHLHSIQKAFATERAGQCGYCIPGIIIATKSLLDENPTPTYTEIKQALSDNLCRCGAHASILRAVVRAAREMAP